MGTALAILLAALVGIAAALLLVPVRLVANGTFTDDVVDGRALLSWGLGLVQMSASPAGAELRIAGLRVHRFAGAHRREKKPRRRARADPMLIWRIVRRSVASLGVHARVSGRVGMGDPADTAQLFALLASARMFGPRVDTRGIEIDWMEPAVELQGEVEGWLWPIAIVSIAIQEVVRARRLRAAGRGAA
jgi:hypothetical protein